MTEPAFFESTDFKWYCISLHFTFPADRTMLDSDQLIQKVFESGNYLSAQKERALAIACYEVVLKEQPDHEWALNNYGYNLFESGDLIAGEKVLRGALERYPKNERMLGNLLAILERQKREFDGISFYQRMLELTPEDAALHLRYGNACLGGGRISEASRAYSRALEILPSYEVAIINYLLTTNYSDEMTVEEVDLTHRRLAKHWPAADQTKATFLNSREPGRRIKVGYNSNDFVHHPVGKIMAEIIPAHDRGRFEIACYHDGAASDGFTQRIQGGADQFHHTHDLNDSDFATLVRSHHVDLFVELTGYTGGRNRLGAIANRVAPVQMSFFAYPNKTGHPEIDYRITDKFVDPPSLSDEGDSEKSLRLDAGFLCFAPPKALPFLPLSPAQKNGYLTFGSFNSPSKISPSCVDAWAEILRQVPKSRLLLKYGDRFRSEPLRDYWCDQFSQRGVSADKLLFENAKPSLTEHLMCIGSVDVCLDPFPYQGTVTTLETLVTGVPIVTLMGESYCRRASSALLLRLGYDELVADSIENYVKLAVRLAENAPERLRLRSTIRARFLKSEICDVAGFVRSLEHGYLQVWEQYLHGEGHARALLR